MLKLFARLCTVWYALSFIGCGGAGSSQLEDHHFILASAEGFPLVEGTTVHLIFADHRISVGADCNGMSGDYRSAGGRLIIEGLSSTQRGCSLEMLDQDERLRAFMEADPLLTRSGDWLTLTAQGAVLRFLDREVADPDRPLVGTVWAIDTLIDEHSFGSSPTGAHPLVQFAGDGSVHIQSTCNVGSGRYSVDGERLTLVNVVYSQQLCSDESGAILEQKVKAVLQSGTLSFEIEARRLTLMRESRGLSAQAQLVQAGPDAGGP